MPCSSLILAAYLGLGVVEGRRQCRKIQSGVLDVGDELGVDLERGHQADALSELGLLAHGRPDVGIDGVGAADGVYRVVGDADGGAGLGGELLREGDDLGVGLELPWVWR